MIAESDDIVEVEGNAHFPRSALKTQFFEESPTTSTCPWEGRPETSLWWWPDSATSTRLDLPEAQQGGGVDPRRVALWRGVTGAQTNKLTRPVSGSGR